MRRRDDAARMRRASRSTAAGVTVLIDAGGGRLPAIVHWGHELPAADR